MFLHSKFVGCLAISMIMLSARATGDFVNNPVAAGGIAFSLVGGQWVSSVPGISTVNEKVSDVTGINQNDLQRAELAAAVIVATEKATNRMSPDQRNTCLRAIGEGLTAHELLKLARKNSTINSLLPEKGTWGDQVAWLLTVGLLHTTVDTLKKATQKP